MKMKMKMWERHVLSDMTIVTKGCWSLQRVHYNLGIVKNQIAPIIIIYVFLF